MGSVVYIVVVGGPCSGKTTVVHGLRDKLANLGYRVYVIEDQAREIIREQQAIGGRLLPWIDRLGFELEVARRHYSFLKQALCKGYDFVIEDSGIPATLAYMRVDGVRPPRELLEIVEEVKKLIDVVLAMKPPVKYVRDSERWEDYEYAMRIHNEIIRVHEELLGDRLFVLDSYSRVEVRIQEALNIALRTFNLRRQGRLQSQPVKGLIRLVGSSSKNNNNYSSFSKGL